MTRLASPCRALIKVPSRTVIPSCGSIACGSGAALAGSLTLVRAAQ
jgi:hypothetical protein